METALSKEKPVVSYKFNLHRMPLEVRLEIFGFLTHKKWIRLAKHNRRTNRVLFGNPRYLAPLSRLDNLIELGIKSPLLPSDVCFTIEKLTSIFTDLGL
jgi:hypothetical protein